MNTLPLGLHLHIKKPFRRRVDLRGPPPTFLLTVHLPPSLPSRGAFTASHRPRTVTVAVPHGATAVDAIEATLQTIGAVGAEGGEVQGREGVGSAEGKGPDGMGAKFFMLAQAFADGRIDHTRPMLHGRLAPIHGCLSFPYVVVLCPLPYAERREELVKDGEPREREAMERGFRAMGAFWWGYASILREIHKRGVSLANTEAAVRKDLVRNERFLRDGIRMSDLLWEERRNRWALENEFFSIRQQMWLVSRAFAEHRETFRTLLEYRENLLQSFQSEWQTALKDFWLLHSLQWRVVRLKEWSAELLQMYLARTRYEFLQGRMMSDRLAASEASLESAEFVEFRSAWGQARHMAWLTQPDIAVPTAIAGDLMANSRSMLQWAVLDA